MSSSIASSLSTPPCLLPNGTISTKTPSNHLEPGVTEFVIHVGYADPEMKAATRERDTWGADWRQRDFDFFSSAEFQKLLRANQIHLITWRDIGRTMNPPAKSE